MRSEVAQARVISRSGAATDKNSGGGHVQVMSALVPRTWFASRRAPRLPGAAGHV